MKFAYKGEAYEVSFVKNKPENYKPELAIVRLSTKCCIASIWPYLHGYNIKAVKRAILAQIKQDYKNNAVKEKCIKYFS